MKIPSSDFQQNCGQNPIRGRDGEERQGAEPNWDPTPILLHRLQKKSVQNLIVPMP